MTPHWQPLGERTSLGYARAPHGDASDALPAPIVPVPYRVASDCVASCAARLALQLKQCDSGNGRSPQSGSARLCPRAPRAVAFRAAWDGRLPSVGLRDRVTAVASEARRGTIGSRDSTWLSLCTAGSQNTCILVYLCHHIHMLESGSET